MRRIRLYGSLGKKFGREHELDVATPAEAVRALCSVVPGFREHVAAPGRAFRVLADGEDQTLEGIHAPCSRISIVPAVGGAKESWETVLIGAALVSAAFVSGGAALAFLGKGAFGVAAKFAVGSMGFSLMFGGVAAMFARNPEGATVGNVSDEPNRAFDGPVNSVGQGNCVGLAYGRIRVGSVVISGSVCTERFPFLKNAPDQGGTRGGNGDTTPWTWSIAAQ